VLEDFDIERHRERLRKMTDEQLLLSGQLAKYLCSPEATLGRPPREIFLIQVAEVKAEWERRKLLKKDAKEKHSREKSSQSESHSSEGSGSEEKAY
jgi:hypothetical protein